MHVLIQDDYLYTLAYIASSLYFTPVMSVSPENNVDVLPSQVFAARGDNVTFNCSTQSGPNNMFQWFKNGSVLDGETSSLLTVTDISVEDGSEYSCLVSNAAGNGSAMASLFVIPEIVQQPQAINTNNGSAITFTCLATGYPSPEYIWSRENPEGTVVAMMVGEESELNIDPVMFGDEGYYRCMAFIGDDGDNATDPILYIDESEAALLTSKQIKTGY